MWQPAHEKDKCVKQTKCTRISVVLSSFRATNGFLKMLWFNDCNNYIGFYYYNKELMKGRKWPTQVYTIETVETKRKPVHFDHIYSLDFSTTRCSTEH